MSEHQHVSEAASFVKSHLGGANPKVGIVLGSGLGHFARQLEIQATLSYESIPHFKPCQVAGHDGNLILGKVAGIDVICQQGRYHFYEGHDLTDVILPVRVMAALGVEVLIVTNAAGGINTQFRVGDMMVIHDHINFTGTNPLIGENEAEIGPRFPDMTYAYPKTLRDLAHKIGQEMDLNLKEGVYCGVSGPTYETPAEIRMYRLMGGDAVGMSTVPEVIAANHCGLKVLGVSCITNAAAGMEDKALDHKDVKSVTERMSERFEQLIKTWIIQWNQKS